MTDKLDEALKFKPSFISEHAVKLPKAAHTELLKAGRAFRRIMLVSHLLMADKDRLDLIFKVCREYQGDGE